MNDFWCSTSRVDIFIHNFYFFDSFFLFLMCLILPSEESKKLWFMVILASGRGIMVIKFELNITFTNVDLGDLRSFVFVLNIKNYIVR